MSEHQHTWVHRKTLAGLIIERCAECRRARRPHLSANAACDNDRAMLQRNLKAIYGGRIADLMRGPPTLVGLLGGAAHE